MGRQEQRVEEEEEAEGVVGRGGLGGWGRGGGAGGEVGPWGRETRILEQVKLDQKEKDNSWQQNDKSPAYDVQQSYLSAPN